MLSRWLQRGRIGQILAPDPTVEDEEETVAERAEFAGGVWNIIAPDPNFNTTKEEDTATLQSADSQSSAQITPTKTRQVSSPESSDENVELLVLNAAKDLASCVASPPAIWDDHKKFFNFCASASSLTEKQLRKVNRMLKKDPSLATCRASKMGFLIPDGFTPLHAAAFVGNYEVALLLIDFSLSETDNSDEKKVYLVSLNSRDVQGRTPLHIASEQGHVNLVKLLKVKMSERNEGIVPMGKDAPLDLAGRTPLAWAATSREAIACKNRDELRTELFSPGDKSVFGKKTPALDRTGGGKKKNCDSMDIIYGFAEMPGHRIEMEDAICHTYPLRIGSDTGKSDTEAGFFGVFDGHGDGGISSNYIADHILQCLLATQEWESCNGNADNLAQALKRACIDIDIDLKAMLATGSSVSNGGTTGIMTMVTPNEVIIGNVGDSRCILVQSVSTGEDSLAGELEKKLVLEDAKDLSLTEDNSATGVISEVEPQSRLFESTAKAVTVVEVKPLSTDHKPDIPEEKARIENSGLEVVEESFASGDKKDEITSIWKIQRSAREKIAVSRAFGDFDYKANEDLKPEEQAIICVPEIKIHKRNHSRDKFLILACDGVFDVMTNDEVGEFVAIRAEERKEIGTSNSAEILPEVGDDLLTHCLELGSTDNMSVLIVELPLCSPAAIDKPRKLEFADV